MLACASRGRKTDLVFLKNGDRVTGEIKLMERGLIEFSTDNMDTLYIEWDKIERIVSKQFLQVELASGARFLGTLPEADSGLAVLPPAGTEAQALQLRQVVRIYPVMIDKSFWQRIKGSISFGYNFTKSTDISNTSLASDARYRGEKFLTTVNFNINSSTQKAGDNRLRGELSTSYRRLLRDRWFWSASGSLERNDELGLRLRTLGGGGMGRFLIQDDRRSWSLSTGIAGSLENRGLDEPDKTGLEAYLSTDFFLFRFNDPKIDLSTVWTVYPSLTESGRLRSNFDIRLRQELVKDFTWDISLYHVYDNQPTQGAEKDDYGIVTSLGYSF